MPTSLLIEKAREWGENSHMGKIDISDAFGSIEYKDMRKALRTKLGCRRALPLFRLLAGTSCNVCWCGEVLEEPIHVRQGGAQGTVEMPTVWAGYIGYTFGALFDSWHKEERGGPEVRP